MLDKIPVENVVIFVSDSLRWDYLPDEIRDIGITFKTIAASLFTASSFSSIVSGLYPNQHKVLDFHYQLPEDVVSILDLTGYNTSLWTENTWIEYNPRESAPIFKNIRQNKRTSLKEIKPPFIYIEDDKGGHAPYGHSIDDYNNFSDFYKEHFDKETLKAKYRKGLRISVKNFYKRIEVLKKRNFLNNTLVIFTSDHGELLGEYGGMVGHGYPACPELVYVPTVFIHPGFKPSVLKDGVIRHVDLAPTILSVLKQEIPGTMQGIDLTKQKKLPRMGYNYVSALGGSYEVSSVWDKDGGHVFYKAPLRKRAAFSLKSTLRAPMCVAFRSKLKKNLSFSSAISNGFKLLKHLGSSYIRYLNPKISLAEAQVFMKEIEEKMVTKEEVTVLPEETKRKLRALGYID